VLVGEALAAAAPAKVTADLATLERHAQQVGRVILGGLVERVAAGQAQLLPRPAHCSACHGALKRRERPRPLVGLVGDYTLRRPYYWCAAGKRGTAPLDAALGLGLGPGEVSPGLAQVVARAAVDATVTPPAEQVQEALGATLSDETARRLAERSGAAARRGRRRRSRAPSKAGPSGRRTRSSARRAARSWPWRWTGCWYIRGPGGTR